MIFLNSLKIYLSILIILTLLILLSLIKSNSRANKDNYKVLEYRTNIKKREKLSCDAYIRNKKQFYVNINGEKYPKKIPLYHDRTINFTCLNSSSNLKTILMWTKFKGSPLIDYGFGVRQPFKNLNCPITNCELTQDRSKLSQSDLVLFHLRNQIGYFPKRAFDNQRFVHVIYESPIHCHLCDKHENIFNLSASYRLDSDFTSIYWTDSGLFWSENPLYNKSRNFLADKIGFGAALISNCESFRLKYLKELSKYVPIDIFGKCGQRCPTNQDCRQYISKNYKFFFLFENSLCRDYVTEKFFDTLKYDIVPVVLGMGNYSYFVPKTGFINALDFKTPKDLGMYLLKVSNSSKEYNKFFKWKKYLSVDEKIVMGGYLCEMCIKLHLEDIRETIKKKKLTNLKQKYGLNENCYQAKFVNDFQFTYTNITSDIRSYYMSPES